MDNILIEFPSISFYICGDFNKKKKTIMKANIAETYEWAQIIEEPTCVRVAMGHQANLLDLFCSTICYHVKIKPKKVYVLIDTETKRVNTRGKNWWF